jgi:hypothetical protein
MVTEPAITSPRLTVEAFAELITAPAYEHRRILHDQKYPTKAPATFMVPYYRSAITAIRRFYRMNNNRDILTEAVIRLESQDPKPRVKNNLRVLRAFSNGAPRGSAH